jgi:hypothetical protein
MNTIMTQSEFDLAMEYAEGKPGQIQWLETQVKISVPVEEETDWKTIVHHPRYQVNKWGQVRNKASGHILLELFDRNLGKVVGVHTVNKRETIPVKPLVARYFPETGRS